MQPDRANVVGWDLGGAHVKTCVTDHQGRIVRVLQTACPLWKGLPYFRDAIAAISDEIVSTETLHAVTMTGEMVDLFSDRAEGVQKLIDAFCEHIAPSSVYFYTYDQRFVSMSEALENSQSVASANWQASARLAADRLASGLLVDIGSTTTDLIPFSEHCILAQGCTDFERMRDEELVYVGVVRTPLTCLAHVVPFEGHWVAVMNEQFANAADVFRLVDRLPAHADMHPSADQAGKSWEESARRLARMIGRDFATASETAWRRLAEYFAEQSLGKIRHACDKILSRGRIPEDAPLVGVGVGRFLVEELARRMRRPYIDFGALVADASLGSGIDAADCGPAVAVAQLLRKELRERQVGS